MRLLVKLMFAFRSDKKVSIFVQR